MVSALWGADNTVLGEIATESVGEDAALAISRGAQPKSYTYTDPNEDAVAVVIGERATLLVAIDGHNGYTSTDVGLSEMLRLIGDDPAPDPGDDELIELFQRVSATILEATQASDAAHPESRAAVVVAFVSPQRLVWAGMGDAPLYLVRGSEGELLTRRSGFIGYSASRENARIHLQTGSETLEPGDWVIAASDGFSDFPSTGRGKASKEAATIAAASASPVDLAERLVRNAFKGRAGDNVAVSLTRVRE